MKKRNFSLVASWLVVYTAQAFGANVNQPSAYRSFHSDYRKTPKLEEFLNPIKMNRRGDAETQAREFLKSRADVYGFSADLKDLKLVSVKESLLGKHYHFEQNHEGVEVRTGEVIVSVGLKDNTVYRAYNNFFPEEEVEEDLGDFKGKTKRALLKADQAYDVAWQDLKVHGKLLDKPKATMAYRVSDKGQFTLVYVTYLNTAEPFGAWEHEIDASTGKVLSRQDTSLERKSSNNKIDPAFYRGPVSDRAAAFATYDWESAQKAAPRSTQRATATGLVFDPDPRTTLNDHTLEDDSAPELFDAAYMQRDLLDLAFDGTTYKLEGPWVKLIDFESPNTPPSTSTTGKWTNKRKSDAFVDVMTYYHLDKNQRYMQSLGFSGTKGIQSAPIEVDANGVNGDDNSHFIPSSNRLAFGHGCVDDNEDADVILHEYGHAINYSINRNWRGGDTGAIGEGFGDYWAGSYSVSTEAGRTYRPNEVFSWDGHGASNKCWPGRALNAVEMRYNPTSTYGAHQRVGSRQSDELWSTPLFQALTTLMSQGVPRDEVDQIVLEAQFGLGAGLKMRDLANATVTTARRLQPSKAHADVLLKNFVQVNIIEVPHAALTVNEHSFIDSGSNGHLDPGETADLMITVTNRGTLQAKNIHMTLTTTTPGVEIVNGESATTNLDLGQSAANDDALTIKISETIACGSKVQLNVTITFDGGLTPSINVPLEFALGKPMGMAISSDVTSDIPDGDTAGTTSELLVTAEGTVTPNFAVDLNVAHPYIGDLLVTLTAPNGKTVALHKRSGMSNDNIIGRYPTTLTPAESLNQLVGSPMAGTWRLKAVDGANGDEGKLVSWGLFDVTGYQCQ